jgi:hypothetical protein
MVRVSRSRVVVLTVDRAGAERFWLTRDYLPGANDLFREISHLTAEFPGAWEVSIVAIPHDCADGFVHAYWGRPNRLLDEQLHPTMAVFDRLPEEAVRRGLERLRTDLNDGRWAQRNRELRGLQELDLGHRLVVWRHPGGRHRAADQRAR